MGLEAETEESRSIYVWKKWELKSKLENLSENTKVKPKGKARRLKEPKIPQEVGVGWHTFTRGWLVQVLDFSFFFNFIGLNLVYMILFWTYLWYIYYEFIC